MRFVDDARNWPLQIPAKKGDKVKISSWQANSRESGPTTKVMIGDVSVLLSESVSCPLS